MHFAAAVPTIPVQRRISLGAVAAARRACPARPPWSAIFAKAYAQVAAEVPALRRAYCKFPWPRLYEYPASVACVAVEGDHHGERTVVFVLVKDPLNQSVVEVGRLLRAVAAAPAVATKSFRRALRLAGLPLPLRRVVWWIGLNVGRQRANHFGTFGVTAYSALGAESLHPLSPLTATLTYGPIEADGGVNVRLVYDHRVLDGATVARALVRLETVINTDVAAELTQSVTDSRAA
jgi:hypothetical protein